MTVKRTLDKDSAIPLYVQLRDGIKKRIETKELLPGDRIESEKKIAEKYGVSVITARNALNDLAEQGLIVRKRGKGTFVSSVKFHSDYTKIQSFTESCYASGFTPGSILLQSKVIDIPEKLVTMLQQSKGSQVIFISRIRTIDGVPMVIEDSFLPMDYMEILRENLEKISIYSTFEKRFGVEIIRSAKEIEIAKATEEQARLLNVEKNTPLLRVESVSFSRERVPVYAGVQMINGEKFKLKIS